MIKERIGFTGGVLELMAPKRDAESMLRTCKWLNDSTVVRYSEQRHLKHNLVSEIDYLRSPDVYVWKILTGPVPLRHHLGNISAMIDSDNRTADVGILIGAGNSGNGIGTVAWSALITSLLRHSVTKVEAGCMANHKAMIRVFEKTGMKYEGRRTKHFLYGRRRVDVVYYGKFKRR